MVVLQYRELLSRRQVLMNKIKKQATRKCGFFMKNISCIYKFTLLFLYLISYFENEN